MKILNIIRDCGYNDSAHKIYESLDDFADAIERIIASHEADGKHVQMQYVFEKEEVISVMLTISEKCPINHAVDESPKSKFMEEWGNVKYTSVAKAILKLAELLDKHNKEER